MNDQKPLVLVVEDEESQLERIELLLSSDFTVLSAQTGRMAIGFFEKHCPDISALVLDFKLPDHTAFSLVQEFEKICYPGVPSIVVQTAFDTPDLMVESFSSLGAISFIQKPFSRELLLEKVHQAVSTTPLVSRGRILMEQVFIDTQIQTIRDHFFNYEHPEKVRNHVLDLYDLDQGLSSKVKTILELFFDSIPAHEFESFSKNEPPSFFWRSSDSQPSELAAQFIRMGWRSLSESELLCADILIFDGCEGDSFECMSKYVHQFTQCYPIDPVLVAYTSTQNPLDVQQILSSNEGIRVISKHGSVQAHAGVIQALVQRRRELITLTRFAEKVSG